MISRKWISAYTNKGDTILDLAVSINNKERKEETMSEAIERTQLHLRLILDTYEKVKKKAQAKGY